MKYSKYSIAMTDLGVTDLGVNVDGSDGQRPATGRTAEAGRGSE